MPLPNQDATQVVTNNGLRTQYGVIIPPGAKVAAFVRSTGIQDDGSDAFLAQNLVTTLAAGLARARPGRGDFVVCLPGHVESVADGTTFSGALVAGTKIIGVGRGSNTPTFNWTTAASQWLVNKADVQIAGLRLVLAGTLATTMAIQVTAADFGFNYNDVAMSSTNVVVRGIQLAAGADRADISGNIFRGSAALTATVAIDLPAVIADARFCDNEAMFAAGANGMINIGAAATNLKILRNVLNNLQAASTVAIVYANVAISGQCSYNTITVLNTGAVTPGTTGITVGGTTNVTGYFQNYVVNDPNKSGLLLPVVDT
jgi:hypothetical protein